MEYRAAPLVAGGAMLAGLMGAALVSPLYPLYQEAWALSPSQVTNLYIIYMLGALSALLFLGRLPDRIGPLKVLRAALTLSIIGMILSCFAISFWSFAFARFLVGIAASLTTTSGTTVLARSLPESWRPQLAVISSVSVTLGFAAGPLVGGIAGQWLPAPLVSAQMPVLALLIVMLVLSIFALPSDKQEAQNISAMDLLPRLSWPERKHSLTFALSCCLPFAGFGIFGVYASVSPSLIKDLLGISGPLVSGLYITIFLTGTAMSQVASRKIEIRQAMLIALCLMLAGNLIMLLNLQLKSLILLVIGVIIASIGHGMSMLSSTASMLSVSQSHSRSGLMATYWVIGYAGAVGPLLVMGWIADHWGLAASINVFCLFILVFCVSVFLLINTLILKISRT